MTPLLWILLGAGMAYALSFALLGVVVTTSWAHGALQRRQQTRLHGIERIPR